jgi:hypothetical protein
MIQSTRDVIAFSVCRRDHCDDEVRHSCKQNRRVRQRLLPPYKLDKCVNVLLLMQHLRRDTTKCDSVNGKCSWQRVYGLCVTYMQYVP